MLRHVLLCSLLLGGPTGCGRVDLDRPLGVAIMELQPDEPEPYRWVTKVAREALFAAIADMGGMVGVPCVGLTTKDNICNPVIVMRPARADENCVEKLGFVGTDLNTIVICPRISTSVWTVNVVVRHEFGHVLGAGHVADPNSIMKPGAEAWRPDWAPPSLDPPYTDIDYWEICSHPWRTISGRCGR